MFNRKVAALVFALVLFIGVGTAAIAASEKAGARSANGFGNLSNVLLSGGYAADYADGMFLFSDKENGGSLTLKNINSGSERVISRENASYINVVGRNIYYVTSCGGESGIVRTTLDSEREVLVQSGERLSNLFVSEGCMYYLKGNSVFRYRFSDGSQSVVFANSDMQAFIPGDSGIYWLKEKPASSSGYMTCSVKSNEGTEEENINYDCYLYIPERGISVKSNLCKAIGTDSVSDTRSVMSLSLTAKVGEKIIPTAEYPVGSYFTDNGEGCSDHGTGSCGWEDESFCNCKSFHNGNSLLAVQCYGFARYVYLECFGEIGHADSETSHSIGSLEQGSVTEEAFKALIAETKPGAHLRVKYLRSNGYSVSSHSMIILDWNESGFSVYESNIDGKCGVGVRRISYSEFVPTLVSIDFIMMPDEYPETDEEETTGSIYLTPSDAEEETTQSETESTSEAPQLTVDTDLISQIFDILVLAVQKFIEFSAAVITLILSMN